MKNLFILTIKLYQATLSPILVLLFGNGCRFTPTCSSYTIEALEKFGVIKGISLGIKRFLRCNPFGKWGYDPLPSK